MPQLGNAIVLIGFMGAGKSSVGAVLELMTGLPRYDIDAIVTSKLGLTIGDIFRQHGPDFFRKEESLALSQIPKAEAIIVPGGGSILRDDNVVIMKRLGPVVLLDADEETLVARLQGRKDLPLLQTENPRRTVSELLRERRPLYHRAADLVIDTTGRTIHEIAEAILKQLEQLRQTESAAIIHD